MQQATSVAVVPLAAPKPEKSQPPQLIAVTVPMGAHAGQTLRVEYGNNNQFIEAQVPMGMAAGSTFYVQANNHHTESNNHSSQPFSKALDEFDSLPESQTRTQQHPFNSTVITRRVPPPPSDPIPFSECLDDMSDGYGRASYTSTFNKEVVKVTVPPNTLPGSTIHVRIPGERNRIIAAIVPPNCTEFNVAYDPKYEHDTSHDAPRRKNSPLRHFAKSHPEQKVLLVRVPPGITAGQTIHVQIPGEPGRAVKAVVPPGDVQEFHVSYTPQR